MKNFIRATCLCALIGFSTSFAANTQIPEEGIHVISFKELSESGLPDFFSGSLPQIAVEIPEGAGLTFNLSLNGEFLALEPNNQDFTIKVIKTCFLRSVEGSFLFSTDLESWAEFEEFFSGNVGVSVDTSEIIPKISLSLELNQK